MSSSYTNTKHKSGRPSRLHNLFRRLTLVSAFVISCAAIYQLTRLIGIEADATIENKLPHGSLKKLTDPAAFTKAYLAVNCNATLLEQTQTIRVAGHMINDDSKEAFTLIKKRPDKIRFTITRDSHQMTFGVSGDTVWRRIRTPQHKDLFALIEGLEAETWLKQRRFFDWIISASLGEGRIKEIKIANWEGADCLQVNVEDANGTTTPILVAPQTMYPIAELQTLPNGRIQQTVFSDYRIVEGMPLPFDMQISINGETINHIVLDTASLNSGILSRLFEIPKALL